MNKPAEIWHESMTYTLIECFIHTVVSAVKNAVLSSFILSIWLWFNDKILNSRIVQYFLDPKYITDAWYSSGFYRSGTRGLRRLSQIIPPCSLNWSVHFTGIYLAFLLLTPHTAKTDNFLMFAFIILALFYLSHHLKYRTGTLFMLITLILLVFWSAVSLAIPKKAAEMLFYLLTGIDFFFLISSAVRTEVEFTVILRYIFLALMFLCIWGYCQQKIFDYTAYAAFQNNITFGGIIVLLFPFAFVCPMTFSSGKRRILYLALLLLVVFTAVTATQSKAAFIGFSAELLLMIIMIDFRYLPLLLFLAPALTQTAFENISAMWNNPSYYGNFFSNLYYTFKNFWLNGFGIDRTTIMNLYSSAVPQSLSEQAATVSFANLRISPLYYSLILELGTIFLIVFLSYLLRLAHSTLTSVFTAQKRFKPYFAAGFATLIGISVSSMMESALLSCRTLLIYWGLLGLLRALKIIRFGIER